MAVFGKRPAAAPPPEPPRPVETPAPARMPPSGDQPCVGRVLVPAAAVEAARSGTDPWKLVQAIVDFVNAMMHDGNFVRQELVQKALQAYHADYYLGQVKNGGHSQFVHNSRVIAATVCGDALAALEAMGAPHADVLRNMMQWVATHAGEADKQTGFDDGRAPFLDQLDTFFYTLDDQDSMIARSAKWILDWPELMIVGDDAYAGTMRALITANPMFADRQALKQLNSCVTQTSDRLQVSIGLGLTMLEPPEILLGIGGGSYTDVEGNQELAFHIETTGGKRKAVPDDAGCRIYDFIDPDGDAMREMVREKGHAEAFKFYSSDGYRHSKLGQKLSAVPDGQASAVMRVAAVVKAAAGIGTLLVKMGHGGAIPAISAYPAETMHDGTESIRWRVRCAGKDFIVDTMVRGAVASTLNEDVVLASATSNDISLYQNYMDAKRVLAPQTGVILLE